MNARFPTGLRTALAVALFSAIAHAAPSPSSMAPVPKPPPPPANQPVTFAEGERARVEALRSSETAAAEALRSGASPARQDATPASPRLAIAGINGKPVAQVAFTPGALYTIIGEGFGGPRGQVQLTGQFPGGSVTLHIQSWSDRLVVILFPADYGGAPDQDGVGLRIAGANGNATTAGGARFVAAREEVMVNGVPTSRIRWGSSGNAAPQASATIEGTTAVWRGWSSMESGDACYAPGTDEFDLASLPPGFKLLGAVWGAPQVTAGTEAVQGVNVTTRLLGQNRVSQSAGRVRVDWAVAERRRGAKVDSGGTGGGPFGTMPDLSTPSGAYLPLLSCTSQYTIAFRLEGPRGVNPFPSANPKAIPLAGSAK